MDDDARAARRLEHVRDLPEHWLSSPFMRLDVGTDASGPVWTLGEAIAVTRWSHSRLWKSLSAWGPRDDLAALLSVTREQLGDLDVNSVSVPVDQRDLAESLFGVEPSTDAVPGWCWLWTDRQPPPHPDETSVVELPATTDPATAAEVVQLYEVANPSAEAAPDDGRSPVWVGIRDGGRLVAVGTTHHTGAGAPHLSGIAVHPQARGRGLGEAITSWLTRWSLERYGVCTLSVYAGNAGAIRLYQRCGYTLEHHWYSRPLRAQRPVDRCPA